MNDTTSLLTHPDYDNDRSTVIYSYGYTEKFTSLSTQTVVESYIARGDHNIVVIEWSAYNSGNYPLEAIPNMRRIGEFLGKVFLNMRISGFNLDKFHLLGHSLGGHLSGHIGRSVFNNSNYTIKLKRITSLDPAGPFFYSVWRRRNKPINKDDGKIYRYCFIFGDVKFVVAIFVDIIHTDSTFFGAPEETGTVDFWPNGGSNQPNCPPPGYDIYNEESMAI